MADISPSFASDVVAVPVGAVSVVSEGPSAPPLVSAVSGKTWSSVGFSVTADEGVIVMSGLVFDVPSTGAAASDDVAGAVAAGAVGSAVRARGFAAESADTSAGGPGSFASVAASLLTGSSAAGAAEVASCVCCWELDCLFFLPPKRPLKTPLSLSVARIAVTISFRHALSNNDSGCVGAGYYLDGADLRAPAMVIRVIDATRGAARASRFETKTPASRIRAAGQQRDSYTRRRCLRARAGTN